MNGEKEMKWKTRGKERRAVRMVREKRNDLVCLKCQHIGTRPDTRPIPVADGWAGAEMRVFSLFDSITMTNGRTDGPTDGRTKPLIESLVRD